MADDNHETAMLTILKDLQDSVKSMKEDNSHIRERLDLIENPKVQASGLVREHSAHSGASEEVDEVDNFNIRKKNRLM